MSARRPHDRGHDHDRDLPILTELGDELETLLRAEFAPRRRSRPAAARVARRSLVAVALASLVGSAALAGRAVVGGDDEPAPATLGAATLAGERWELSGDRLDQRLCATFASDGAVERTCFAALAPDGARAGSALGGRHRIVYGLAGREVARVRVTVGRHVVEAPARDAADRAAADAGLPTGVRWFAVDAGAARAAAAAPARVTPLDRRGGAAGAPWLDCTLGAADAACVRAAGAAGAGGAP